MLALGLTEEEMLRLILGDKLGEILGDKLAEGLTEELTLWLNEGERLGDTDGLIDGLRLGDKL